MFVLTRSSFHSVLADRTTGACLRWDCRSAFNARFLLHGVGSADWPNDDDDECDDDDDGCEWCVLLLLLLYDWFFPPLDLVRLPLPSPCWSYVRFLYGEDWWRSVVGGAAEEEVDCWLFFLRTEDEVDDATMGIYLKC